MNQDLFDVGYSHNHWIRHLKYLTRGPRIRNAKVTIHAILRAKSFASSNHRKLGGCCTSGTTDRLVLHASVLPVQGLQS